MNRSYIVLGFALLMVACSNAVAPGSVGLTKEYVAGIDGDSDAEADACAELGLSSPCDLCDALDWYADGTCDEFCTSPDADCSAPPADGTLGGFCGGIAGIGCDAGLTCVDNTADECDPEHGGADCGGICVSDTAPPAEGTLGGFCGGIAGLGCDAGLTCVDNPIDACDAEHGGADCGGICVAETAPPADGTLGGFCGGIAGLGCNAGLTCVDNPIDACDAEHGGADCGGICVADH